MHATTRSGKSAAFVACLFLCAAYPGKAGASSYAIVYQGAAPTQCVLAADAVGNLYVEAGPGSSDDGSVFELTAASNFSHAKLLYTFGNGGAADGNNPVGGVTLGARNVILGTTEAGGVHGDGVAFNLGRARAITFTALHAFSGLQTKDGAAPQSGLTAGPAGRYYGTTTSGGVDNDNAGTLFSLTGSTVNPTYQLIHSFGGAGDGKYPQSGRLTEDAQGRLYGTTSSGGSVDAGTVFIVQKIKGAWQEQVIFDFSANFELFLPRGNVVLDSAGNVYGCAKGGRGEGGVYELTPPAQGQSAWTETVLYRFYRDLRDPVDDRMCALAIDPDTRLIVGTADRGGANRMGAIFTLTPPTGMQDAWTETVVHSFSGGADGAGPMAAPLKVGNTYYGGNSTNGAIYAFTP